MDLKELLSDLEWAKARGDRDYEVMNGLCCKFKDLNDVVAHVNAMKAAGMLKTKKKQALGKYFIEVAASWGAIYLRDGFVHNRK